MVAKGDFGDLILNSSMFLVVVVVLTKSSLRARFANSVSVVVVAAFGVVIFSSIDRWLTALFEVAVRFAESPPAGALGSCSGCWGTSAARCC